MNVKNIISFAKKIEAGNAKFDKLSKKEKRVAIAKDALAQLLVGKFQAVTGQYVQTELLEDRTESIGSALRRAPRCKVCAIGSVLVSSFRCGAIGGDIDSLRELAPDDDELVYDTTSEDKLKLAFTPKTLRAMESAFEQGTYGSPEYAEDKYGLLDEDARLFAILEDVIENEGSFKKPKRFKHDMVRGQSIVPTRAKQWAEDVKVRFETAKAKAKTAKYAH